MTPRRERVILHLDMDAFYAAIEVRDRPELGGQPLIIGHRGRRGVVATCSYDARRFGVHSAMPSLTAERLCPNAIWLPVRMERYVQVSRAIRVLFDEFTPLVEPISIDEAFLDLTGIARDLAAGADAARRLKARIREEEGLTASVGVAPNKFLAKLASDLEKPDGLVVFPKSDVPARLWPMPAGRLWGVGPKTAARLRSAGIETVGAVLERPETVLVAAVGQRMADHLRALARGEDDRPVEGEREAKSISEERTYRDDLVDPEAIDRALLERAEGVAAVLRRAGLRGKTVHLKVRTGDFTTWTRAHTLPVPTDLAATLLEVARRLLAERIPLAGRGVRLLGVGVSALVPSGGGDESQIGLFGTEDERARRIAAAADDLRDRHGRPVLVRARSTYRTRSAFSAGESAPDPESDKRKK